MAETGHALFMVCLLGDVVARACASCAVGPTEIMSRHEKFLIALVHGGFGRKSAKNPKSEFRRSNRDQIWFF